MLHHRPRFETIAPCRIHEMLSPRAARPFVFGFETRCLDNKLSVQTDLLLTKLPGKSLLYALRASESTSGCERGSERASARVSGLLRKWEWVARPGPASGGGKRWRPLCLHSVQWQSFVVLPTDDGRHGLRDWDGINSILSSLSVLP